MRNQRNIQSRSAGDTILVESIKYGPVVTFLLMALVSGGIAYLVYSYFLYDWAVANDTYRAQVLKK